MKLSEMTREELERMLRHLELENKELQENNKTLDINWRNYKQKYERLQQEIGSMGVNECELWRFQSGNELFRCVACQCTDADFVKEIRQVVGVATLYLTCGKCQTKHEFKRR